MHARTDNRLAYLSASTLGALIRKRGGGCSHVHFLAGGPDAEYEARRYKQQKGGRIFKALEVITMVPRPTGGRKDRPCTEPVIQDFGDGFGVWCGKGRPRHELLVVKRMGAKWGGFIDPPRPRTVRQRRKKQ